MTKIVQVKKNSDGDITGVKFDNGSQATIQQAIDMARNNLIDGVMVGKAKNGRETLRSRPNDTPDDNLDNLPRFE